MDRGDFVDVHFIINGKAVTRDNWRSFSPAITEGELDRVADTIFETVGRRKCPQHGKAASITCRGTSLRDLEFEAAGCCREFERVLESSLREKLARRAAEPVEGVWEKPPAKKSTARRLNVAFGPIMAGAIIDLVDVATFGPLRRFIGFPAGAIAGYWMASIFKLPQRQRLLMSLAAGIYCLIPGHSVIPLATMIGAYIRFRTFKEPDAEEPFQA